MGYDSKLGGAPCLKRRYSDPCGFLLALPMKSRRWAAKMSAILLSKSYICLDLAKNLFRSPPVSKQQRAMIAEARKRHGEIFPCATRKTIEDCFTNEPGVGLLFWFNDSRGNTHVIRRSAA